MITCMITCRYFQCIFTELFFLQAAGVSLQSNMFLPNPPYRPGPSIWDRRPFFWSPCEFWYLFIARASFDDLISYVHLVQTLSSMMLYLLCLYLKLRHLHLHPHLLQHPHLHLMEKKEETERVQGLFSQRVGSGLFRRQSK